VSFVLKTVKNGNKNCFYLQDLKIERMIQIGSFWTLVDMCTKEDF
jgi:hypothetical protein